MSTVARQTKSEIAKERDRCVDTLQDVLSTLHAASIHDHHALIGAKVRATIAAEQALEQLGLYVDLEYDIEKNAREAALLAQIAA